MGKIEEDWAAWDALIQTKIDPLVLSMERRLDCSWENKGNYTQC